MYNALVDSEEFLNEWRFAKRIALQLVKDYHLANEVAQEAALAALQRGDVKDKSRRAWIKGVVRNLVLNRGREARRRGERESRYARETFEAGGQVAENAAEEALQRGEQRARVAKAVMDLPEPYRTVVVLRYMEELSPPRIAKELGRPVETVKSQLRRGMAKLRDALDAESGRDGHTWALALLPLAAPRFGLGAESALAGAKVRAGSALPTVTASLGALSVALLAGATVAVILFVSGVLRGTFRAQPDSPPTLSLSQTDAIPNPPEDELRSGKSGSSDVVNVIPRERRAVASGAVRLASGPSVVGDEPETASAGGEPSARMLVLDAATGRPLEGATVGYFGVWSDGLPFHVEEAAPLVTRGTGVNEEWPDVSGEVAVTTMAPVEFSLEQLAYDEAQMQKLQQVTTDTEGVARISLDGRPPLALCLEVSHRGYETVHLTPECSSDQINISVELHRSAPLTIRRGDLDENSVVAFMVMDMIMDVQATGVLAAGSSSKVVADLPPGKYRISGSAYRPAEGRPGEDGTLFFAFHDLIVKPEDEKPAALRIWEESAPVLRVHLKGIDSQEAGLQLRASGRYQTGRASIMAPFESGVASVAGLLGPTLQLEVLKGEESLLKTSVVIPEEAAGPPVELTVELPTGALRVIATDGAEALPADDLRYTFFEIGALTSKPFVRTGVASASVLRNGLNLEHLPSGRFEFWWSMGRRVGMDLIEIGAGNSTLEIVAAAPTSSAFSLRVCECVLSLSPATLYSQSGAAVPVELADWFQQAATPEPESMEDPSEPLSVELFLPHGSYRVELGSAAFHPLEESFTVGSESKAVTMHAKGGGSRVELQFTESTSPGALLLEPAETERVAGERGYWFELGAARTAVLYLTPGHYRAMAADGRSADFHISEGASTVILKLRQ